VLTIGMTYDLRAEYLAAGYREDETAEFDSEGTISGIADTLQRLGHRVDRIGGIRALAVRLSAGARWDLVFNLAEGLRGRSREAQVPALLEAFDVPYVFSDPLTMAATLDKSVAKRLVATAGVATAPWCVLAAADDVSTCPLAYPVFAKPLAEGSGKGCSGASRADDPGALRNAVSSLTAAYRQPVLVEPLLPGREFTVGIVGNGGGATVLGVMEIELLATAEAGLYSFLNKEEYEDRVRYRLADDAVAERAGKAALAAFQALDCRDAARLDFRCDADGVPQFLECNPLAGLNPVRSDLPILARLAGYSFDDLIAMIVAAAVDRLGLTSAACAEAGG
jgi:D-alanine-D-alanine ligase